MLESQTLEIQRIELRKQINGLGEQIETRADDPETETRIGERLSLFKEMAGVDDKMIAALKREDEEAQAAMARNVDTAGWTAELREFHQLGQRTNMGEYMRAGLQQRALTPGTPEHEYNSHVFGNSWAIGEYPIEMLLDRGEYFSLEAHQAAQVMLKELEQRAEITGVVGTAGNLSFVDRILADSEGAYCRATFPAVGPGRHSYPIVSGSANAAVIARTTAETPAGGISVMSADPERIQHSYEVAHVDELQMPGIMEHMVSDLRRSLASGVDEKVIDDLTSGLGTAVALGGTTTVTLGTFLSYWASGADGVGARYFDEVRVLCNAVPESGMANSLYQVAMGFLGSAANQGAFDRLAGPNCRGSNHLPATTGADKGRMLVIRNGAGSPNRLIAPVWRRAMILRDSGRLQLQGADTLTGVIYMDVILAGTDMHRNLSIETA